VPITGKLIGATTPAPELQKAYYYNRYARRQYRRAYRRDYYGAYYGGLVGGGYCNRGYCGVPGYYGGLVGGGYCNRGYCGGYYSRLAM
jgi:hypothetical protein